MSPRLRLRLCASAPRPLLWALAAMVLTVIAATWIAYRQRTNSIKQEELARLQAVAKLKAQAVERWLGERRADGEALTGNPATAVALARVIQNGDAGQRQWLLSQMSALLSNGAYSGIQALGPGGQPVLQTDPLASPIHGSAMRAAMLNCYRLKKSVLVDLHAHENGPLHMGILSPVIAPGGTIAGSVFLDIKPETFLYPYLASWPLPSETSESLLVRRDGDKVIFLNPLRHTEKPPLTFQSPVDDPELPAAKALRKGGSLLEEGTDYRGVPVFFAAEPVAGTPWTLVAKVDQSEALAASFRVAIFFAILGLLGTASVTSLVALLWQRVRREQAESTAAQAVALDQVRQRLQALFDHMLDGYGYHRMIYDEKGTAIDYEFVDVNPAFERLTGLKGVTGRRVTEVIPGIWESNREMIQVYERVVETGVPERFEAFVPALERHFVISVYRPEPQHFVVVFDNITERKLARLQLEKKSRLYHALSETNQTIVRTEDEDGLFQAICSIVLEMGSMQLVLLAFSDGESEMLTVRAASGEGQDELLKASIPLFPADGEALSLPVLAFRNEMTAIQNDFSVNPPHGILAASGPATPGLLSAAAMPIRRGGCVVGVLTVGSSEKDFFDPGAMHLFEEMAMDISFALDNLDAHNRLRLALSELTESRYTLEERIKERTNELLREKERAESADRVKTAFLSSISHELRTPLNSIIGFTGVLLQELAGPVNEDQAKQLRFIQNAGRHLLALINDLLDISRIEAGKLRMDIRSVDLSSLVKTVAEGFQHDYEGKGIPLLMETGDPLPRVEADSQRLEQVLNNLLSNALKFTDAGHVIVRSRAESGSVIVEVEDTGIGISAEDRERLFRPFVQLEAGRARQGTGLGLSICRHLMEAMGGQISLRSESGKGSTFTIRLPAPSASSVTVHGVGAAT